MANSIDDILPPYSEHDFIMASAELSTVSKHPSASMLVPDILVLVFGYLRQDQRCLPLLRLVSRQFNDLVIPLMYYRLTLNDRILQSFYAEIGPKNWTPDHLHLCNYTRHLRISKTLHWRYFLSPLEEMLNLRDVTWSLWDDYSAKACSIDAALTKVIESLPNVQLHIEGLDLTTLHRVRIANIPSTQLASLKTVRREPPILKGSRLAIKMMTLSRPNLKSLHLRNATLAGFKDSEIKPEERLPPIEELILQNYKWEHSPHVANSFWNWDEITCLELDGVDIGKFLETVPSQNLLGLQSLVMADLNQANKTTDRTVELLSNLLSRVRRLVVLELSIYCKFDKVVAALAKHGSSLRYLTLRGYGEGRTAGQGRHLTVANLRAISISCPHLVELTCVVELESYPVLLTLAQFRNIRRLTLFTWTPYRVPFQADKPAYQVIEAAVSTSIHVIRKAKCGAELEKTTVHVSLRRETTPQDDSLTEAVTYTVIYDQGGHLRPKKP